MHSAQQCLQLKEDCAAMVNQSVTGGTAQCEKHTQLAGEQNRWVERERETRQTGRQTGAMAPVYKVRRKKTETEPRRQSEPAAMQVES